MKTVARDFPPDCGRRPARRRCVRDRAAVDVPTTAHLQPTTARRSAGPRTATAPPPSQAGAPRPRPRPLVADRAVLHRDQLHLVPTTMTLASNADRTRLPVSPVPTAGR
ncbi:hypothetical protein HBB16_07715 [Pseudonocardia sp. MCCB 268]|nr:hypothetical protein [Pseudonocardia cytotoxica]